MENNFQIFNNGNCLIVILKGKLLAEDVVSSTSNNIVEAINDKSCNLVFDLSELKYVNSLGLNLFMRVLTKARVNNGDVTFFGVIGDVEKLFKIAKLNEIFSIYESKEAAINHFK